MVSVVCASAQATAVRAITTAGPGHAAACRASGHLYRSGAKRTPRTVPRPYAASEGRVHPAAW